MKIIVGTKNPVKIEAVREVIKEYKLFREAEIFSLAAQSNVSKQPKTLEETISGAINRARNVYYNLCKVSFGIESGLMKVPFTKTGFMDVCACSVYDGNNDNIGLSCALEFPIEIVRGIMEQGLDVNEATYRSGLTSIEKIGSTESALIGILTKGRITRKNQTKQAIEMALIHLTNPELYEV
jgi:inosine/xanthosine triphosphatase